jgi:hypothetical protein
MNVTHSVDILLKCKDGNISKQHKMMHWPWCVECCPSCMCVCVCARAGSVVWIHHIGHCTFTQGSTYMFLDNHCEVVRVCATLDFLTFTPSYEFRGSTQREHQQPTTKEFLYCEYKLILGRRNNSGGPVPSIVVGHVKVSAIYIHFETFKIDLPSTTTSHYTYFLTMKSEYHSRYLLCIEQTYNKAAFFKAKSNICTYLLPVCNLFAKSDSTSQKTLCITWLSLTRLSSPGKGVFLCFVFRLTISHPENLQRVFYLFLAFIWHETQENF